MLFILEWIFQTEKTNLKIPTLPLYKIERVDENLEGQTPRGAGYDYDSTSSYDELPCAAPRFEWTTQSRCPRIDDTEGLLDRCPTGNVINNYEE